MTSIDMLSFQNRILNAFNSILLYISKFLAPLSFSPIYPYSESISGSASLNAIVQQHRHAIIAFIIISFIFCILAYRKKYQWLFLWLFYLITLSPVIGIIQVGVQSSADRYAYLPILPFYILIGTLGAKMLLVEHVYAPAL